MAFKLPTYNLPFPEKRNKIGEKIYLIGGGQKKIRLSTSLTKQTNKEKKEDF